MMRRAASVDAGGTGGFTLMELLVALTLLGMLMAALFGGVRLGTRVWEASSDRLQQSDQIHAVRRFLRQRLEGALPVIGADRPGPAEPLFIGETSRLRLASPMPAALGQGIMLTELILRGRGDRDDIRDLIMRWRPWPILETAEAGERVLLDEVGALAIAYFGVPDRGAARTWHDRWPGDGPLPELIRIELQFPAGDARRWQPLVVSPMVDEWYDTTY